MDPDYTLRTLWRAFKLYIRYASGNDLGRWVLVPTLKSRFLVDALFFIENYMMFEIVKGVTIDAFQELRLAKAKRMSDTLGVCFICGIEKLVFERAFDRTAFERHIKTDHNMWNYLYFIIYLWEQDKDDDDGLELFVRGCIDAKDISWFPINKSVSLINSQAEEVEDESLQGVFRKDLVVLDGSFKSRLHDVYEFVEKGVERICRVLEDSNLAMLPSRQGTRAGHSRALLGSERGILGMSDEQALIEEPTKELFTIRMIDISGLALEECELSNVEVTMRCGEFVRVVPATGYLVTAGARISSPPPRTAASTSSRHTISAGSNSHRRHRHTHHHSRRSNASPSLVDQEQSYASVELTDDRTKYSVVFESEDRVIHEGPLPEIDPLLLQIQVALNCGARMKFVGYVALDLGEVVGELSRKHSSDRLAKGSNAASSIKPPNITLELPFPQHDNSIFPSECNMRLSIMHSFSDSVGGDGKQLNIFLSNPVDRIDYITGTGK